jgi:hypothetical protein
VAIMPKSAFAHSSNVSCWREGARTSLRLVWRVITPITAVPSSSRRTIGTALTLVGVSSNHSGLDESTISPSRNASRT